MAYMHGGLTSVKPATEAIQEMVDEVTDELKQGTGRKITKLTAINYRAMTVAGINYFVKVRVDDGDYIHLRIYQPLPYMNRGPSLSGYLEGKTEEDKIEYF